MIHSVPPTSKPRAALPVLPGERGVRRLLRGVPVWHRLALLTWVGVYPVLTLAAWLTDPVLADAPVALRTLVMSVLMVPAMVYAVIPFMRRRFCEDC